MDRKIVIIGLLAVGALVLLTQKKPKARNRIKALSGLSLNTRKVCRADVTNKKIHCRVQNPKEFGAFFMRTSTTPGIKYVMGMPLGTEKAVLQSVLFDKKIWGTREAKTWFNRNIKRLMQRDKKTLRLDDLGKGKMHSEDYFTSSTPDMFQLRRELVITADDDEPEISILSKDPLEDCLKRQGWNPGAIKKTQEAISAKLTMDMFGKVEKLNRDEIRLQDNIQNCLERIKK